MTEHRTIAVFGGTGFLGRRVVRNLRGRGFAVRVASRHPERGRVLFGTDDAALQSVAADINDENSVAQIVAGCFGVVNAVSLYVERGGATFRSVHVEAAARLARRADQAGVRRLVHMSGIGADARSRSSYIRCRAQGEAQVRDAFPSAVIVRPSVMVAADDAFLARMTKLVRYVPVIAMFGRGRSVLEPVYVEDVAEAMARILEAQTPHPLYELGGPDAYTFKALLQLIARHVGAKPLLVPLPFALWHAAAWLAELLPNPPLARNQVELMRASNTISPDLPGFAALGIAPRPLAAVLSNLVRRG